MSHPKFFLLFGLVAACGGNDVVIGNDDGGADARVQDVGTTPTDAAMNDVVFSDVVSDVTATFDPSSVSGLVLWLEASANVTQTNGAVSLWGDKTTNHNDAKESTAALQPTFVANAFANQPAIHFNKDAQGVQVGGDMMTIADATTLQWGTGDFYLIVVARYDNTVADGGERGVGLFWSKPGTGANFPGVFFTANIAGGISGTPTNGFTFSTSFTPGDYITTTTTYSITPHAFAAQRVGTGMDLRIDGVSIGTSNSAGLDVSNAGVVVSIGGDGNGQGIRLNGDVAEMLAVKGTLSQGDRTSLEQYVNTKYGL